MGFDYNDGCMTFYLREPNDAIIKEMQRINREFGIKLRKDNAIIEKNFGNVGNYTGVFPQGIEITYTEIFVPYRLGILGKRKPFLLYNHTFLCGIDLGSNRQIELLKENPYINAVAHLLDETDSLAHILSDKFREDMLQLEKINIDEGYDILLKQFRM